jgi:alkylation response protein AidB-like acyl-CoA dehydrogenase
MAVIEPEDRDALQESVRGLLDRHASSARVREVLEGERKFDRSLWEEMCNLGWAALLVPERFGGAEAGMSAAVLVLQGLGARFVPSPYLSSAVLATVALTRANGPAPSEWLPRLASGEAFGTVALSASGGRAHPGLYGVTAQKVDAGHRLAGKAWFVLDPDADVVIVAAAGPDGTMLVAVPDGSPGLSREPIPNIDRTRELAHLVFEGVPVTDDSVLATGVEADDILEAIIDAAAIALGADGIGSASAALTMAVEYAKQRVQFGRLIGSFQAIKHKLADDYVLVEASKATIQGAALTYDLGGSDVRRRAAAAGSFVRQSASRVVGDSMQVHGGIGFTWEHDCHLLMKRAKFDEFFLTDLWSQRDRLLGEINRDLESPRDG